MTDKRELNDAALESLFSAARAEAPEPSAGLVARVLADADREAAWRPAPPRPPARLFAALGGWPGMAGLATAGVAGLAIGLAAPEALDALAPGVTLADAGYGLEDLMPGLGTVLEEG